MDPFSPRDKARLDYWFWKFHVDDLALLVDVIVRRQIGRAEVRVSMWVAGEGRVIHSETTDWSTAPDRIHVGSTELRRGQSAGSAADISWELRWREGDVIVSPLPGFMARVEPFDTTILAWPFARFDGWVRVGSRRYDLSDLAGTFFHYWGRALSTRWVWLSATDFESDPMRRLEAIVAIRTHLLGGPTYPISLGFLWSADRHRSDLTISTINGVVRARPVAGGIAIDTVRIGGPRHHVVATWGDVRPNDIGEGIVQTMHADLTIDGHRANPTSVGLETRAWPTPAAVAAMPANR